MRLGNIPNSVKEYFLVDNKAIGKRIQKLRESQKASRVAMAGALGIKETRIQDIERGKQKVPVDLLTQFAGYFGVDVRYILTGALEAAEEPPAYETGTIMSALSKKETALLDNYRRSSKNAQDALIKTSAAFAQQARSQIAGKPVSSSHGTRTRRHQS